MEFNNFSKSSHESAQNPRRTPSPLPPSRHIWSYRCKHRYLVHVLSLPIDPSAIASFTQICNFWCNWDAQCAREDHKIVHVLSQCTFWSITQLISLLLGIVDFPGKLERNSGVKWEGYNRNNIKIKNNFLNFIIFAT